MTVIPKRTKYKFQFRNKTRTRKIGAYVARQHRGNEAQWLKTMPFETKFAPFGLKAYVPGATKYKQPHQTCNNLLFGTCGFASDTYATLSASYVQSLCLDIKRALKKRAKVWLRVCCDTAVTARPVETRMGKGKGSICEWQAKIRPGQILVEFSGIGKASMNQLYVAALKKAPLKLTYIG